MDQDDHDWENTLAYPTSSELFEHAEEIIYSSCLDHSEKDGE